MKTAVFIPSDRMDNNHNVGNREEELMNRNRIGVIVFAFVLTSLLVSPGVSPSKQLSEEEIRQTVVTLINSENKVHIENINVETNQDGLLDLKITTNFGDCWGKEEFAKGFAKDALKALFSSDLPLSHVILDVQEANGNLMTIALGKNQAENIDWDNADSLEVFYKQIKSRMNYKGNPTDYCWIIEGKPSPGP